MSFPLVDDGTPDTVRMCSRCREWLRWSWDGEGSYLEFCLWTLQDAEEYHECPDDYWDSPPNIADALYSQTFRRGGATDAFMSVYTCLWLTSRGDLETADRRWADVARYIEFYHELLGACEPPSTIVQEVIDHE